MEKKVYYNLALISIITAIVTSIALSIFFHDFYNSKEAENLKNITTIIANQSTIDIKNLPIILDDNIKVEIYKSNTLPDINSSSLYYDLKLDKDNILRVSQPIQSFGYIFLSILPVMASIIVFLLIILYLISSLLTDRIIEPIKNVSQNIESILSGESVEIANTYYELEPFIRTMDIQKEEIQYSINRLKEAEKIRREFTANVSHELKTPLTSINGFAEMIETGMVKGEDAVKSASIIHKEGIRLLNLIDSIIQLSQLDDINIYREITTIDLFHLAKSISSNLAYKAKEKDISLSLTGESTELRANQRMIEDLIFNLVDNAIKYNKSPGKVHIKITSDNDWGVITVSDTGIGIPVNHQDRIFERFYMVDKSRSKKVSGTGLGLSIVKHIVEYHKGKLELTSIEGQGTTVEVKLAK